MRMRGHVFIVNERTLPKHLEYMFVGTSAGEKEHNISLLADMMRVKGGDFIFFYIEGKSDKKGRFFGIFKAKDDLVYHVKGVKAKQPGLSVKLVYRKFIEPYEVYENGVLEWIALDKLPIYSREILWTLIYRKMKARRGNTMLFPWETKRLINLIQEANNGKVLSAKCFSFDNESYKIRPYDRVYEHNWGNEVVINWEDVKKSETYFQAYILQNLKVGDNDFYPEIFGKNIVWIGNEVFAGSGMQKIDLLTIERESHIRYIFRVIELKHPKSRTNINFAPEQLEYYINWAREDIGGHLLGARQFNIKPILLVLTKETNSISEDVVNKVRNLKEIALEPEIWEIDFEKVLNQIL
jgi:Holliday junction resolvase